MSKKRAVIGLDGLSVEDLDHFDGTWNQMDIETIAHTCPSWNAIFSGREREDVLDFFKVPENYSEGEQLAAASSEMWDYHELQDGDYIWEEYDVEVVSAPVVLPTFSTLIERPDVSLTWPTTSDEFSKVIDVLTEKTKEHDDVITVFPLPDKMNHRVDESDSGYTDSDRQEHLKELSDAVRELQHHFDEWIMLSDHGKPSSDEWVLDGDLWISSHEPTGVLRSNVVDTRNQTNISVNEKIGELFE